MLARYFYLERVVLFNVVTATRHWVETTRRVLNSENTWLHYTQSLNQDEDFATKTEHKT